jgi:hypothetical protein
MESLILWKLIFWSHFKFWLLIPSQLSSWQKCSPMLWNVSSVWWPFPLLCKRFLFSRVPISQSFLFITVLLEFYPDAIAYAYMLECFTRASRLLGTLSSTLAMPRPLDFVVCAWYFGHAYFAIMTNCAVKTFKYISLYFYSFISLKSI